MSKENLKQKTKKGLLWCTIERISSVMIQFIISIILARILEPSDYGIIALPILFLTLAQVLIDGGFSNALVRKTDATDEDFSTAFIFNVIVGSLSYLLLFLLAPCISRFYNIPILKDVLRFVSLVVLFNSLTVVQTAKLTQMINFKTQSLITILSTLVTGVFGIILAYKGLGVWALAFQQVSMSFLRFILLWIMSNWKPKLIWNYSSFYYLWNYGSKILTVGILDTLFNNAFPIIIGKFYNSKDLGLYTRAQQFSDLPSNFITGVLQRVTFPVLSNIQNDFNKLQNNFSKLLSTTFFIVCPLMIVILVLSKPIITTALGEKWLSSVPFLQLLCIARLFSPINSINLNLLQIKGRSDLYLKLELIKKIIVIGTLIITVPLGINQMLYGTIATTFIAFLLNGYCIQKLIGFSLTNQIQIFLPIIILTLVTYIAVKSTIDFISNDFMKILIGLLVGCIVYLLGAYFTKMNAFVESLSFIVKK